MNRFFLLELVRSAWLMHPDYAAALMPLAYKFATGEKITADAYPKLWKDDDDESEPEPKSYFFLGPDGSRMEADQNITQDGLIAVVKFDGVLSKYSSSFTTGVQENADFISSIRNNKKVAGSVAWFCTPGGSAQSIARSADVLKSTGKPMVGYFEDRCCSGGAWLMSGCDEAYASHATDVYGSIGVMCSWTDWKPAYEKEGVKFHEYYAKQSSLKNAAFRNANAGKPEMLIDDLTKMADDFIAAVMGNKGQKLKIDGKHDMFKGDVTSAENAMSFGLIDGVASFESVVNRARELAQKQFKRTSL
jgi:protease-4